MSRRERQQEQITSALACGHYSRALVLAREHLAEFPDDDVVRDAAAAVAHVWRAPEPET